MVSVLDCRSSCLGQSPGQGHSWARHFILTVPPFTQVYEWVPVIFYGGSNPVMDQHPIQGEKKFSQSLRAMGTRISSCLMDHLVYMQTLWYNLAIQTAKQDQDQYFLMLLLKTYSCHALSEACFSGCKDFMLANPQRDSHSLPITTPFSLKMDMCLVKNFKCHQLLNCRLVQML